MTDGIFLVESTVQHCLTMLYIINKNTRSEVLQLMFIVVPDNHLSARLLTFPLYPKTKKTTLICRSSRYYAPYKMYSIQYTTFYN